MKTNLLFFRRMLLVCAAVFVVVGIALALGVIPPVKADPYPGAAPKTAAAAFWVNIGLNLLAAFTLFFIAMRSKSRSGLSTSILVIAGFIVFLLGLALVDAASAFLNHGPPLRSAVIVLFICAAFDLLGGALVVTTAFLRPKKR